MSIEVYIINLLIGLGTFIILRWTFKRLIKTDKVLRNTLTWTGTILITPLIYLGLIAAVFNAMFYEPSRDFDKVKWFDVKEKRYEMRDDIIDSRILLTKTKKEIIDLIGLPDFGTDSTNVWNYDLGMSGAGLGWQFNTLLVTFNSDRVVEVRKQEILD